MIRANESVDSYERDGRSLLLFPHRLVELGPLAATILSVTAEGITLDDLVVALVDTFGEPDDVSAAHLVETCVNELASYGVLTVEADDEDRDPTPGEPIG